jgi:tRNA A-37 threonylcarbamoyl transferase component Bud32
VIGEQLGSYRIVREIGRGGMGSVWLGEHVELGHRVAIKVLLPQIVREPETVQRFFNEARAAARVRSPGIVQIVDFGRAADGAPYLAMELLEGETLRARLRAHGRLSVEDAATIGRQVATTLAAAHAAGIVHRDLKPDNIMMVDDPEVASGDRPKILDFGIAKLTEEHWASSVQTRTGSLLGTPHYMAPEQCRGTGDIDARTDVYALGCILFELVCGRPPFVSQGVGEIVGMHQFVAAPAPTSLRPDIPAWFEAVILRAHAQDPSARYASMDELAAALEAGGAPAARTGRGAGDDREGGPTSIGLQETIATPPGLAETMKPTEAYTSEITEIDGDEASRDLKAITADAQRRATELANQIAREHEQANPSPPGGRRMTVIAVAVVVMAAVLMFVKLQGGMKAAEPRVDRGPKTGKPDVGFVGEPDDHAGGSGTGSGTSTGSGVAQVEVPVARDAGVAIDHQQQHVDAGRPAHKPRPDAGAETMTEEEKTALFLHYLDEIDKSFTARDFPAGLRNALSAIELFPDDPQPYGPAAIASCHLGKPKQARRYYKGVVQNDLRDIVRELCAKDGIVLPP